MDNIFSIENFDFSKILLKSPKPLQGGTYYSKLLINNKPIFIQTPKCFTKNGIHKTGKKVYCDLKFDVEDELFIEWLMKMENKVRELIFEKRNIWFHDEPSMEEIEYNWNTSLRTNKNNYLLRTFIQKNNVNNVNLQIWDNENNLITLEDFSSNDKIICILEIQGLKYTIQSFHLEICMKQMMVIKEVEIFNKCLININHSDTSGFTNKDKSEIKEYIQNKTNNLGIISVKKNNISVTNKKETKSMHDSSLIDKDDTTQDDTTQDDTTQQETTQDDTKQQETTQDDTTQEETTQDDTTQEETTQDDTTQDDTTQEETTQDDTTQDDTTQEETTQDDTTQDDTTQDDTTQDDTDIKKDISSHDLVSNDMESNEEFKKSTKNIFEPDDIEETLEKDNNSDLNNTNKKLKTLEKPYGDLEEVELNITECDESVYLKKRKDVYLEIYKTAREKAKKARNAAIKAYLEAKTIKETYLLDEFDLSDDEIDLTMN